jgi:hypothetical protein
VDSSVTLFPISRVSDPESVSNAYVSQTTEALMYTLGVLFCILGFCFLVVLVNSGGRVKCGFCFLSNSLFLLLLPILLTSPSCRYSLRSLALVKSVCVRHRWICRCNSLFSSSVCVCFVLHSCSSTPQVDVFLLHLS